jgi:hypothetical protein
MQCELYIDYSDSMFSAFFLSSNSFCIIMQVLWPMEIEIQQNCA